MDLYKVTQLVREEGAFDLEMSHTGMSFYFLVILYSESGLHFIWPQAAVTVLGIWGNSCKFS
jgi:hypothetical protein